MRKKRKGVRGKEKRERRGGYAEAVPVYNNGFCYASQGIDGHASIGLNPGFWAMRRKRHRSLRMTATRADFFALPALTRRL